MPETPGIAEDGFFEFDVRDAAILRRTALVCMAITAGISGVAILGWALNWLIIARINPDYIPMAPNTALCFILLSMGLLFYIRRPEYYLSRMAVIIGTVLVLLISAVPLAGFFAGIELEIEHFLFKHAEIAKIPIGHMSPITAVNFLLGGVALLLLVVSPANRQRAKSAATSLVTIVFFVGLIVLLGYLYKTPLLYGGTIIPVALPTSVAFVFLSAGIIAAAGPYYWPINLFIGLSVRARLMRSFFPSVIAIIIFAGWVDTMIFPWLNNHVLTTSLVIISSMIIIGIIVSRIAKVVGGNIDRAITERKKIEDALMFLAECGSKGDDFFQSLAQYFAKSLGMDYICIDRLESDRLTAQTVAVYFDGKFEDNVSYTLHDTPCGEVVGKAVCCFPEGVRHRFPKDVVLQDMKAESYVGVTLWSHTHEPIGSIAAIGRQPLAAPQLAESVLKLVAIRAAAELERKKAEEALQRYSSELENSNKELQDALAKVKQLSGMLPICAGCKKIRDDKGYWKQIEVYIRDHSEAKFTHGLCPDCAKKAYEELDELKKKNTEFRSQD